MSRRSQNRDEKLRQRLVDRIERKRKVAKIVLPPRDGVDGTTVVTPRFAPFPDGYIRVDGTSLSFGSTFGADGWRCTFGSDEWRGTFVAPPNVD